MMLDTPVKVMVSDPLEWFSKQGGGFCRVAPHDKKPMESGWQNKPLSVKDVLPHVKNGGNVGVICGKHSGGLCLLDLDDRLQDFLDRYPEFRDAPIIQRQDAPNRGKIVLKIVGDIPTPKKSRIEKIEFLSTGNQGVIPPSIHPSGTPYELHNADRAAPEYNGSQIMKIFSAWEAVKTIQPTKLTQDLLSEPVYFDEPPYMDDEPPYMDDEPPYMDDEPPYMDDEPTAPQVRKKPRYQILKAFDALQPQAPIEWIVDGLISAGSVNIFYGEGGSKKTWALLDMAVCVARGESWINFATKAGGVLIVDEESGQRRIMRRLGDALRGHNAGDRTPVYCVSLAAFDFGKPNDIGELYNLIATSGAQLVIVDALADVMPGRDENAVKDVQPIFLSLRRIAEETQTAIIIIHHSNKNGGYRGSTAIKGALDLLLSVESEKDSNEIKFKTEKARDTTASSFGASAVFMPDSFWLSASVAPESKIFGKGEKYVLRYLLTNGEDTVKNISDNADVCASGTARNCIYSLADIGLTRRTDIGAKGAAARYELTDKGSEVASKL